MEALKLGAVESKFADVIWEHEPIPSGQLVKLCEQRLEALRQACRGSENTVPYILDCARAYCTLYEIRAAMEEVFGAYREPVFF
mgnify:CR=1 FL=1